MKTNQIEYRILFLPTTDKPEVGKLSVNKNDVYTIPADEEDCLKSAEWFGNRFCEIAIVSNERVQGDDMYYVEDHEPIRTCTEVDGDWVYSKEVPEVPDILSECQRVVADSDVFTNAAIKSLIANGVKDGDRIDITFIVSDVKCHRI